MTIGERIKNRRMELGLSQEELAIRMGITNKSTVCKMESNQSDAVSMNSIKRYAKALNVTPAYLLGNSLDKPLLDKIDTEMLYYFVQLSDENKDLIMNLVKKLI